MTAFQKILTTLLFIAFIGLGLGLIWLLITRLMVADPGITAAVIAALVAVAGTLYTHIQIRKREVKAMHFTKKKTAYMLFIDVMFEMMLSVKNKTEFAQKDVERKMMAFRRELLVWGNHEVFQALEEYEQLAIDREDTDRPEHKDFFSAVEKLLRAMRKDLGHEDSQLKPFELVSVFIVGKDKEKFFAPNK